VSKAFTKDEGSASDDPVVVPPRASLPDGATNYVTPRGLRLLREELAALDVERESSSTRPTDDPEHRRLRLILDARVAALAERIATATLVDPRATSHDEVRFGARVTVRDDEGKERTVRIVGVDESDVTRGDIAFVAPLARALLGKRRGEAALVRTPRGEEELEVIEIDYAVDPDPAPAD